MQVVDRLHHFFIPAAIEVYLSLMLNLYFMRLRTLFLFLCLAGSVLFLTCAPEEHEPAASPAIKGLWQLHSMQVRDSLGHWSDFRGGMQGYLLYDDAGHMALHLATKDYEQTDLQIRNFSDTIALEKLKYLTNFYGYMGRYRLLDTASIVEHTRISHSNPNDWGKTVQRRFQFDGDTLIITPVESANANLKLKWLPTSN